MQRLGWRLAMRDFTLLGGSTYAVVRGTLTALSITHAHLCRGERHSDCTVSITHAHLCRGERHSDCAACITHAHLCRGECREMRAGRWAVRGAVVLGGSGL